LFCLDQRQEVKALQAGNFGPENGKAPRNRKEGFSLDNRGIPKHEILDTITEEVGAEGEDETKGGKKKNLPEVLGTNGCDFFRAEQMKVGAKKILSGHCPNEAEEHKGASGGKWSWISQAKN
jgi:hypothetical protein